MKKSQNFANFGSFNEPYIRFYVSKWTLTQKTGHIFKHSRFTFTILQFSDSSVKL